MGVLLVIILVAVLFVCIKDKKACFKKKRVLRQDSYDEESRKGKSISRNL